MRSFELVVDNSKVLANCFEGPPPPAPELVFDLGFRKINQSFAPFATNSNVLAVPDDGLEFVIPNGSHSAYSNGYWAEADQVTGGWPRMVFLPTVPEGYTLTTAQYVVKAYREFANSPPPVGFEWGSEYGPPDSYPFLYVDSAGTSDYHSFFPLPIGGYGAESISHPSTELLSRVITASLGVTSVMHQRMWYGRGLFSESQSPIHISYFGLRLTYTEE